ncbi:MAG: hypothetical protein ERJ67_02470 [Aphanocapsa feldmannii 277cV]|uniref:Uncharacterized protein n=2 Tax=Aphanocapsa feldmannii TaxID=192050 RepID=A0A524RQ09_9CHRO|nr:MAG: hypothetical protein ERJ69_00530 [Aphanocapsa feldmannii 288cV]TGG94495.1 MAG: hypothetical protein ERJ67_02470 [Aphanocapsa feldmannii 277cV]TGH23004.1 MAG: hypothetical protein ERJ68_04235 [Aphanocapsa feldmannii 277cI]
MAPASRAIRHSRGGEPTTMPRGASLESPCCSLKPMFCTPWGCDSASSDWATMDMRMKQAKLRMLRHWLDGLDRRRAAVQAAIDTLEQQIQRDTPVS